MEVLINGIRYTYEYKEIHIGDKVLSSTLDSVYEATIMDADNLGFVVISEEGIS